jgi:hypothetical protein
MSETPPIEPGVTVVITDAAGREHTAEALSAVEQGHRFTIVWVNVPLYAGGFEPTPWPADAVRVAANQSSR